MNQSLTLIKQANGLLTLDDQQALANLAGELQQTFTTAQVFRTDTEMRVSVLNDVKRPTPDAKYWQATREQDVFLTELVNLSYEYRKVQLELKRLRRKLEIEQDDIEQEALALEIEHQTWVATMMMRTAHHRVREIEAWAQIKEELKPHLKYGEDDVNAHQLEAMRLRYAYEAQFVNEHTPVADARNILGLAMSLKRTE